MCGRAHCVHVDGGHCVPESVCVRKQGCKKASEHTYLGARLCDCMCVGVSEWASVCCVCQGARVGGSVYC